MDNKDLNLSGMLYDGMKESVPEKGTLLVSEPMMGDSNFSRSVVLILEKDSSQGYIGLILNKQTNLTMGDMISNWEKGKDVVLFDGGPVDPGRLFMIHTLGEQIPGAHEVIPGIWVGGDLKEIAKYIQNGGELDGKMRFFLGYSGWTSGQLEEEIRKKAWAVQPDVEPEVILSGGGEQYWRAEVERLGDDFRSWLIVPRNPNLN